MKEATIQEHPDFPLMKPEDVSKDRYMRMPGWLFTDPRYIGLSLDAKVVYTFLADRFSLSRKNGWVNERGEVFVIFPRLALAKEMRVCEQRVTEAFRELRRAWLIWEEYGERKQPNRIYLAEIKLLPDAVQEPPNRRFLNGENGGSVTADSAVK